MSDELEYGEEGSGEQPESTTIQELRAQIKEKDKRARQAEKEADELRTFKEQFERTQRESEVKAKFAEAGLPEQAATLYLKDAEAPEDVTEWAGKYGFTAGANQGQTIAPPPNFSPTVGTPPGPQAMSPEEFAEWAKRDPQAAFSKAVNPAQIAWRHQASRDIAGQGR